jgi:hypothetical protein
VRALARLEGCCPGASGIIRAGILRGSLRERLRMTGSTFYAFARRGNIAFTAFHAGASK